MGKGAIPAALIDAQEPDDGSEEDDGRFHEEVTLLLHPRAVEVEHDGVGTLVGIRNVGHEVRVDGVAAVAAARVVEVDDVELRLHLVPLRVVEQMVVGNHGEVGKLEVIHIHRISFLYLLLDEIVHHGIRLAAARRAQHDGGTEGIDHVDPAPVPPLAVVEACGQVHGIVVLQQPCLLHETLVLRVEHILHQVVLQQAAHPQPAHQQADVARADGGDVQARHRLRGQWQHQYPPVEEEQHTAYGQCRPNSVPSDFLALHALRAEAGKGKQEYGEQLCVEDGMEQPRRAVEVHQNPVHHADVHAPQPYSTVAVPIHVHHYQYNTHGTQKIHDFRQCPQIVFL